MTTSSPREAAEDMREAAAQVCEEKACSRWEAGVLIRALPLPPDVKPGEGAQDEARDATACLKAMLINEPFPVTDWGKGYQQGIRECIAALKKRNGG